MGCKGQVGRDGEISCVGWNPRISKYQDRLDLQEFTEGNFYKGKEKGPQW